MKYTVLKKIGPEVRTMYDNSIDIREIIGINLSVREHKDFNFNNWEFANARLWRPLWDRYHSVTYWKAIKELMI